MGGPLNIWAAPLKGETLRQNFRNFRRKFAKFCLSLFYALGTDGVNWLNHYVRGRLPWVRCLMHEIDVHGFSFTAGVREDVSRKLMFTAFPLTLEEGETCHGFSYKAGGREKVSRILMFSASPLRLEEGETCHGTVFPLRLEEGEKWCGNLYSRLFLQGWRKGRSGTEIKPKLSSRLFL